MKCPVCRATYQAGQPTPICRRCGADLSTLVYLHDQAIWHYRQAIALLQQANYPAAHDQLNQAIALNQQNATFHTLEGQLWAIQGQWKEAIAAWKTARRLDPKEGRAIAYLRQLMALADIQGE